MKLSVIIPVYNEEKTLLGILSKIKEVKLPIEREIIIIDDFSKDKTREILSKIKDKEIKIFYHEENKGKGYAIRTGLKQVTGEIVIIQDADLEYDPQDYDKLIQPILDGKTEVVYGSRILGQGKHDRSYLSFYLGGVLLSKLANFLYNIKITDEPTCYKVFKTEVIKNIDLKCERFEFCPEVTAKIAKKKYQIYEVPISYHPRNKEEGKKINWVDGLQAIWILIKYRFSN
tara:strand:+ start:2764 stop:3453 length:690 start_codon:yes stop_codon:yes gene_type:complete